MRDTSFKAIQREWFAIIVWCQRAILWRVQLEGDQGNYRRVRIRSSDSMASEAER
jgi:hypothetical protein